MVFGSFVYSKFFFRIVLNKIPKYRKIFLLIGTYIFSVPGLKIELPQNFDLIFVAMLFMDAGYILRNAVDENSPKIEKLGIACFFVWIYLVWNQKVYTDFGIKYMVMKIYKSSKHTLTKGRVTGEDMSKESKEVFYGTC